MAVAEKVSALRTMQIIEDRIQKSDPEAFRKLLDRVPDTPPIHDDDQILES